MHFSALLKFMLCKRRRSIVLCFVLAFFVLSSCGDNDGDSELSDIVARAQPNFMTFYGQVSYDARYFEIGVGLGGAKTTKFGVSATQFLRIGTHDGLNLKATTYLIGIEKFEFHGMKIAAQVPTDLIFKNTWIVGRMSVQDEGELGLGYVCAHL